MNRQRLSALVCVLVLLATLVVIPTVQADQTDTVYVRKHVSLLYDDSGSMSSAIKDADNLKWCYASYAAQVFTGLLNESDSLTITFMNQEVSNKRHDMTLDLSGDRQAQVQKVLNATDTARGGTPFSSIQTALNVLISKGLLSDAKLGSAEVDESEQFWLVLTTDGNFNDDNGLMLDQADVESALAEILEDYSNLQMVYFAIGTKGDTSSEAAIDLRSSRTLTAYPNFSAYFAEDQDQIVSTMQELSNLISGRYDVSEDVSVSGRQVTIRISGESSPIRNVAVLAQETNARLVSAVAEDGTVLEVSRSTSISYPTNRNYDNVPSGTLGGCTAMITSPTGKIPEGTVTLTFSENVNADSLSLMYEPAIYVTLNIQRKNSSGQWEDVLPGRKLTTGDTLRVQYEICEDGSDTPLDADRLPGESVAEFTCGDRVIRPGEEFRIPAGNTTLTATVSLMDGAYRISTSRTIQAVDPSSFRVSVSDPLTLVDTDLAGNTQQHIDFTVTLDNAPVDNDQLADFRVDTGGLQGQITQPGSGVIRFTPRHSGCTPGNYTITLYHGNTVMASQTVSVITITYSAAASGDLTLISDRLAGNTEAVTFQVTSHRGTETAPITQAESDLFRIDAKAQDGTELGGAVSFRDGSFTFTPNEPDTPVGDYTVTLYQGDTALADATVTILPVTYSATASGDLELIDVELGENDQSVTFRVTAQRGNENQPITEAESAQFRISAAAADGTVLNGTTGFRDGSFVFTPNDPDTPVGEYTVAVQYDGATLAQATVTIIPDPVTFTAEVSGDLAIFSNVLAANTEPVVFTVTSHREEGDAPLTAEEYTAFRVEAVNADGTAMSGVTSYQESGQILFVTDDADAPVGDYTVTLYYGDQALASGTISVLQYNATYTAEVFLPDDVTVDRFDLAGNDTAVLFVIYADGIPCTGAQLSAMLESGAISLSQGPDSFATRLDAAIVTHGGKPAVSVRPAASAGNFLVDFFHKMGIAWNGLPLGDLTLTLTVNAVKGTSASGTLEVVQNFAVWLFFLLLPIVLLAVTALVLRIIYCNLKTPRIRPGKLRHYTLKKMSGGTYLVTRAIPQTIKIETYIQLTTTPRTITYEGIDFTVDPSSASPEGPFGTPVRAPTCIFPADAHSIKRYAYITPTYAGTTLMNTLRGGCATIKSAVVSPAIPTTSTLEYTASVQETGNVQISMEIGGLLIRRNGEVSIDIWTFEIPEQ